MASPIDRHPFSPRLQLGRLGRLEQCALCGELESHESHQTDEQAKRAALDKHLTDTAREIAPKLRSLVGEDQQTVVTIALELARSRVTMHRISTEEFKAAADELAADVGRTLHAYAKHAQIREVDRTLKDGRLRVTRMREVVCARCERLYCPELGECPCSVTCCQNGPRLGCPVHGEALRSHLEETEKRHRSMASPEAEAAARRDHGDGDGRIPGRPECPSNECQIRQTCTGHANCTRQYARAPASSIEETLEAAYWTFDAARGGRGEWKGRTLPERDAFKLAVRRAAIGEAARAELSRPAPPHPTTPCIGCNPLRPCFNGWKACQRESDPIGSLLPYTHQTVVPKGDPVEPVPGQPGTYSFEVTTVPAARGAVLEQIAEERIRQDTKWGGPSHDDTHERGEWLDFIREHLERAKKQAGQCPSSAAMDAYRHELVVIAALAVAAIETHDRAAKAQKETK